MSFFTGFFDIAQEYGEHQVLCPFPHKTVNGIAYQETTPSAHVNIEKGVYHCKACNLGLNENTFIQKLFGCDNNGAQRILYASRDPDSLWLWNETYSLSQTGKELCERFHISEAVAEELHIATPTGMDGSLAFPVSIYGMLLDVRTYTPEGHPKCTSRTGAPSGLIIPYDIWKDSTKATIICAGEKDMAVARSNGLNAITFTGGEQVTPRILEPFRDRAVVICYDNDEAGLSGAYKLANTLYAYTQNIKVCTGFHEICKEPKEDITDFFVKYGKTKQDLVNYFKATPNFVPRETTEEDDTLPEEYPHVSLAEASQPQNRGKILQSNIQVVAVTDTMFAVDKHVTFIKAKATGNDTLIEGETREWSLTSKNSRDILHLVDGSFKEEDIYKHLKQLARVPAKEDGLRLQKDGSLTVYKAYVTDMFETNQVTVQPTEYQVYSLGHRLESGQKYTVTYQIVTHPYKGQQLVMIITDVAQANDSVSNFIVTDEVKEHLSVIRNLEGTVTDKVNTLTEKVKGLIGYNGNNTLIQAIDFAYHTVLQYNFGHFKDVRGYLDTLVVGESRVGKSSTADALRKEYGLGIFTSLAGNSATIPGLIGGSNKTNNGFQTRAGVIPQNHRGLVIFEEFGKCKQDIVSELTDIRSSNEVRIARVSGTITMPAMVRMISLTNVKSNSGSITPIASYPNGIAIVKELVSTAEDIARYDLIVILSDKGNSQIDPFWQPSQPLATEVYQDRVRWVWSRTPEQIQIDHDVAMYIMERSNALNVDFDSHIKIFGTEAWKKLSRLAIALAGYCVSTNDTYENIVVTKEHVDYAESFFRQIYDNPTFKLREYVQNERLYSQTDEDGIAALQDLFNKYPALILQLEKSATASKNMLLSAAGLTADDLNKALSRLTKGLFITYSGYDITPTERFRKTCNLIDRKTVINKVGE